MNISQWKTKVKERDDYTCRAQLSCNGETNYLHVHHIKPRSKYPELAVELDNGITLCGNCHARLKGKEESINLKVILPDKQTAEQLTRLHGIFCGYLCPLVISDNPEKRVDAVFLLLNQLQIYPDSLNQFMPLIQVFIIDRADDGLDGNLAKRIMLEFLKRNSIEPALQMRRRESDVYMRCGRDYLENRDYTRAIANFDRAIELNPNHASYYARGEAHYKNRDYACAIEDFTIAIKFNPNHASIYRNRASAYYNRGDYDRAITDCTKVIELDSNYAVAYYIRGKAYDKKGDTIRSNADFDTVTELQMSDE